MEGPSRFIAILTLLIAPAILLSSCGGGEKAAGPEVPNNILTVPAGNYEIYFAVWTCGTTDTMWLMEPVTECNDVPTTQKNDLFPCPVTVENDLVSFKCSEKYSAGASCTITREYDFAGIQIDDIWLLTGTIRETTASSTCSPSDPCSELDVYIRRVGPAQDCPTLSLSTSSPFGSIQKSRLSDH